MSVIEWGQLLRGPNVESFPANATEQLQQALQLGTDVAPGLIAGCSITQLDGTKYSTPASSDELANFLDEAQYAAGRGPCMAAARDHQVHHLRDLRTVGQFQHFGSAAIERGVFSSLSLPLEGTYRPAALNFYATSRGAFDDRRPRTIAGLLARAISARMLQSGQGSRAEVALQRLSGEARARADLVRRAQVRLAEECGSPEAAFSAMAIKSQEQGRSIFDIARQALATGESPA